MIFATTSYFQVVSKSLCELAMVRDLENMIELIERFFKYHFSHHKETEYLNVYYISKPL